MEFNVPNPNTLDENYIDNKTKIEGEGIEEVSSILSTAAINALSQAKNSSVTDYFNQLVLKEE